MHPDKVGPYLISRKIGSGGMGNVYLGSHEETGEEAAVKVLPASMAREPGFVQRFSREIDALRKVSSPHIVRIFRDGQTEGGSYYFSMEYIDGETLTSVISRRRRIPWNEVIDISLQIAAALKAAHDAGIVHRDLKPSNLMLAKDGTVKLADFGVAHVFATTRLTRTGGVVGTAEYMSPEQARGQRATKLSDLYSLGAVMYVMLTGRPPFTGKLASDILHRHQHAQFDKPSHYVPELPRLLEDFVCRLLEKKPDQRLPDAFVVIRQLHNIRARIEFEEQARAEPDTALANSADHRTAGVARDQTLGSESEDVRFSRGPATMMRDAIRADLEAQLKQSPLARFFDNTLVLVLLLALVIAAGYYLSRTSAPNPNEQLAEARELLQAPAGAAWLRARDDILQPLLEAGALPEQRGEIEQLIHMADQYEFCRGLQFNAPADGSSQAELKRLIAGAFDTYASGDIAGARRQLESVLNLLTDKDVYLKTFLTETLSRWNQDQSIVGRAALLQRVLDDSRRDADDGTTDRAVERLKAALQLYETDGVVSENVRECRELLDQLVTAERP
ncbi:MAG: serine/threonine-protein kinase [Fuerstiella sp.]